MAFPSIRSQNTTNGTTATTTPVVNLPATVVGGDILLVFIRVAVAGAIGWPDATWHEIIDASPDGADDQIAMAWKVASGSEGGTTITLSSGNGKFSSFSYSIQDAAGDSAPPELSTVATGTTGQPNATTCTPTSPTGATTTRDYLWITFVGNEGEQTGITSYPTNYTLGQTGLANSGTGGLPATNTTCAAAARQNNATSEDAGAWTVAGTLSNWSAYTLAIHPAGPFGSEVSNTLPPRFGKPFILTTLASRLSNDSNIAFNQLDWPNPAPARKLALTWVNNNLEDNLAPLEAPPFNQLEWKTFEKKPTLLISALAKQTGDVDIPFNQLDWENSTIIKKQPLTWLNNNQNNVLLPSLTAPFNQLEWNIPKRKDILFTGVTAKQTEDVNIAFNQLNWPNPNPKLKPAITWINDNLRNTLAPITNNPFIPPDFNLIRRKPWILLDISSSINIEPPIKPGLNLNYDNPILKKKPALSWLQSRPTYYQDIKPFKPDNYPNPLLKKRAGQDWNISKKIDEPSVEYMPCSVLDWPNPAPKKVLALNWISIIPQLQQLFTKPVGSGLVQPHTLKLKTVPLTWIQSKPFYYPVSQQLPFTTAVWERRDRKIPQIHTIVNRFNLTSVVGNPFNQREWINPLGRKRLPESWEFYYQQDDNQPPVAQTFNLPLLKKISTLSWIQNPLVATPISGVPFNKVIFDNPLLAKKIVQSWINPSLSVSELPIFQPIWINPLTRNKLAETWIQNRPFYLEDLIPFSQNDYPNPLLTKISNRGYIFNQQIEEVTSPQIYDYPNPKLRIKEAESWINNLLQSTLNPGAGDVPFYQNDWPIPDRKKIGLDWIFSRPFIFEVVAVPFVKSEWPNPEVIIRNPVGHISYLIPQERIRVSSVLDIPLKKKIEALTWLQNLQENTLGPLPVTSFTQKDWPNPLRGRRNQVGHVESRLNYITGNVPFALIDFKVPGKKGPAITYIYNSLINLNEVVGIQPFNQYDWPLVRGKGQQNKGFAISGGYILPNIIGRIICLNADVTLYDLEAALQEFDLDATTTEYDLEAGGTECE